MEPNGVGYWCKEQGAKLNLLAVSRASGTTHPRWHSVRILDTCQFEFTSQMTPLAMPDISWHG